MYQNASHQNVFQKFKKFESNLESSSSMTSHSRKQSLALLEMSAHVKIQQGVVSQGFMFMAIYVSFLFVFLFWKIGILIFKLRNYCFSIFFLFPYPFFRLLIAGNKSLEKPVFSLSVILFGSPFCCFFFFGFSHVLFPFVYGVKTVKSRANRITR